MIWYAVKREIAIVVIIYNWWLWNRWPFVSLCLNVKFFGFCDCDASVFSRACCNFCFNLYTLYMNVWKSYDCVLLSKHMYMQYLLYWQNDCDLPIKFLIKFRVWYVVLANGKIWKIPSNSMQIRVSPYYNLMKQKVKAQVSFLDHSLSGILWSVCLSVCL